MSNKTEGTLFFDPESGRYDIRFGMVRFMADYIVENALR